MDRNYLYDQNIFKKQHLKKTKKEKNNNHTMSDLDIGASELCSGVSCAQGTLSPNRQGAVDEVLSPLQLPQTNDGVSDKSRLHV